jgi:hypothetical protein
VRRRERCTRPRERAQKTRARWYSGGEGRRGKERGEMDLLFSYMLDEGRSRQGAGSYSEAAQAREKRRDTVGGSKEGKRRKAE